MIRGIWECRSLDEFFVEPSDPPEEGYAAWWECVLEAALEALPAGCTYLETEIVTVDGTERYCLIFRKP